MLDTCYIRAITAAASPHGCEPAQCNEGHCGDPKDRGCGYHAHAALIQPYAGHASRQSLEMYSHLAIEEARDEYNSVIGRFPVYLECPPIKVFCP